MQRAVRWLSCLTEVVLVVLAAVSVWVGTLHAEEIALREAQLRLANEGLMLEAEFKFDFPPRLAEAVANGVPLYFLVEFEMTRPRWYWIDERAAEKRLQLRLSYHALSRQYVVSNGPLEQQFESLDEALGLLRRIRNWVVGERIALVSEARYDAAVRLRLDTSLLPKPIQLSALTSNEWRFESAWNRFAYRSPLIVAPVESRDLKPEVSTQ